MLRRRRGEASAADKEGQSVQVAGRIAWLGTRVLWHKSMDLGIGIDPANVLSVYQMLFAFFCTVSRHY